MYEHVGTIGTKASLFWPLCRLAFWAQERIADFQELFIEQMRYMLRGKWWQVFRKANQRETATQHFNGWWFGCHQFYFPIHIGLLSSSQLTHSYFSEGWPTTTNQTQWICDSAHSSASKKWMGVGLREWLWELFASHSGWGILIMHAI